MLKWISGAISSNIKVLLIGEQQSSFTYGISYSLSYEMPDSFVYGYLIFNA